MDAQSHHVGQIPHGILKLLGPIALIDWQENHDHVLLTIPANKRGVTVIMIGIYDSYHSAYNNGLAGYTQQADVPTVQSGVQQGMH